MALSPILSRDIVTTRLLFNAIKREKYVDFLKDSVVGDYKWSACNVNFHGWMKCDGSALNSNVYSTLYNVIGTTYGGSGVNFNLPDCRGRALFAAGQPTGGNIVYNAHTLVQGELFGNQLHKLTLDEMPSHVHTGTTNTSNTGITINPSSVLTSLNNTDNGLDTLPTAYVTTSGNSVNTSINDPWHNHTFTTNHRGGSNAAPEGNCTPHDIKNPSIVLGNVFLYSGVYEPYVYLVDEIGPNDNTYNA